MIQYDDLYKSPDNTLNISGCKCIPKGLSIARNAMAFDLGFPNGWNLYKSDQQNNYTFISEWIRDLYRTIHIMLVVERFNESVVLLKRYMCWGFKDILFRRLRTGKHRHNAKYSQQQQDIFQKWSNVDTLLHYLADRLLNKRIRNLGKDFQDEVTEYIYQETQVLGFCRYETKQKRQMYINATKWDAGYTVTPEDCAMIMDKTHLRDKIKEEYDNLEGDYSDFPLKEGYNLATYC